MYLDQNFVTIDAASPAAPDPLDILFAGRDLTSTEAESLFGRLVDGALNEPQIAAMLVALRVKGETSAELIGAARALRAADAPFDRPAYLFADTCGTGGDGSGSVNISTAVAFVAAAAGLPVAKHGNRSFTSRCGSADVLEALGARLDPPSAVLRRALDETGFCFLFAPAFHPGLKHAGPTRRALKVRTIMNLLGPCLNPAEPPVQLLGVADASLLEPIAQTLDALGVQSALVVHGSGLDEIALHAETQAIRLTAGTLTPLTISPELAGLSRGSIESVRGGGPKDNAARLSQSLQGKALSVERDLIAINSGALLFTAGIVSDLREGVALSLDTLASGASHRVLTNYIEASRG